MLSLGLAVIPGCRAGMASGRPLGGANHLPARLLDQPPQHTLHEGQDAVLL